MLGSGGRSVGRMMLPSLMRSFQTPSPRSLKPPSIPNQPLPSLTRAFSLYDQITEQIKNVPDHQLRFQSLSIFQLVRPVPEILVLGCGKYIEQVDPELQRYIRSTGMKLEAVDSRNAASTYNILNEEGRIVAAAFIPYGVSS